LSLRSESAPHGEVHLELEIRTFSSHALYFFHEGNKTGERGREKYEPRESETDLVGG